MAPLIDVVFLLLIFFMLSSTFLNPSLPLTLPEAREGEVDPGQLVVVSVDENGVLRILHREIDPALFAEELSQQMERYGTRTVYFQGDADMPYEIFVRLMDQARGVGAEQFHIIHRPER